MRLSTFLLLLFAAVFVAALDAAAEGDESVSVSPRLPKPLSRSRIRAQVVVKTEEEDELGADDTHADNTSPQSSPPPPPPPSSPPLQPRRVHEPSFAWSPSVLPITGEGVMAVLFAGVLLSAAYFGL